MLFDKKKNLTNVKKNVWLLFLLLLFLNSRVESIFYVIYLFKLFLNQ